MARVEDVTDRLIADARGPGDRVKRVQQTKAPRTLSPTLTEFFAKWKVNGRNTIGWISNALAYGDAVEGNRPSHHANMIKLIKGGHIRLCEVAAKPAPGTTAHRDSPYGDRFYYMTPDACPTELDPMSANLRGAHRRRRR